MIIKDIDGDELVIKEASLKGKVWIAGFMFDYEGADRLAAAITEFVNVRRPSHAETGRETRAPETPA